MIMLGFCFSLQFWVIPSRYLLSGAPETPKGRGETEIEPLDSAHPETSWEAAELRSRGGAGKADNAQGVWAPSHTTPLMSA